MASQGSPQFGLASLLLEAAEILERRDVPTFRGPYQLKYEDHTPGHVVPRSGSPHNRSRSVMRKTFDVDSDSNSSDSENEGMKSSSSDSGSSFSSSSTKAVRNKPYRRPAGSERGSGRKPRGPAQHNEVEKRRRAYLSSCYVELHGLVPTIKDAKASNVTILQSAAEHIHELESDGSKLEAMVERERLRRKELLTRACLPDSFLRPVEIIRSSPAMSFSPSSSSTSAASDALATLSAMSAMAAMASSSPGGGGGGGGGHSAYDEAPVEEDSYAALVPDVTAADEEMVPTVEDAQKVAQHSPLKAPQHLVKVAIVDPESGSRRRSSRRPIRFT